VAKYRIVEAHEKELINAIGVAAEAAPTILAEGAPTASGVA